MCLGELGEVLSVRGPAEADVRVGARTVTVSLLTLAGAGAGAGDGADPLVPGDRLLVHSGYALARLTAAEAAEAQQVREQIGEGSGS